MCLLISGLSRQTGTRISFNTELDFSDFMFGAQKPVKEPVYVSGEIFNKAGVIFLLADVVTNLHCVCDRCAADFTREYRGRIELFCGKNRRG